MRWTTPANNAVAKQALVIIVSGGSKGKGTRDAPLSQNCFIFMWFLEGKLQNNRFCIPLRIMIMILSEQ